MRLAWDIILILAQDSYQRAFLCLDNGEIVYRSEWDDPEEEDEDEFVESQTAKSS